MIAMKGKMKDRHWRALCDCGRASVIMKSGSGVCARCLAMEKTRGWHDVGLIRDNSVEHKLALRKASEARNAPAVALKKRRSARKKKAKTNAPSRVKATSEAIAKIPASSLSRVSGERKAGVRVFEPTEVWREPQ